jgi:RNA polymerase sigma-70 factor (ECF subfamily)
LDQINFIKLLREKNENAFKKLVTDYQDQLYHTILGIVQNEADAEDLTQDVFIKVLHSIEQFKGESLLSTWLYRIAVTKSLDFLRRKKRKKRFAFVTRLFNETDRNDPGPADFLHPGILNENKEDARILLQTIGTLSENQRTVFLLHKMDGLNYKEIAAILEVSEPAVDSLLQRAKQNLRKKLKNL